MAPSRRLAASIREVARAAMQKARNMKNPICSEVPFVVSTAMLALAARARVDS